MDLDLINILSASLEKGKADGSRHYLKKAVRRLSHLSYSICTTLEEVFFALLRSLLQCNTGRNLEKFTGCTVVATTAKPRFVR